MRRTKLLCRLTLEFNRVNGEDALSSSELCAHNCCRTKSTDTNNGDVVTGLHFSRIDRRTPAGRGATAKEHHLVERKIGEHLHCRPLVNDGMRREGSETSHDERVLAFDVDTRRSVKHAAAHDHGPIVTKVGMAVGARGALPAHCNKREHDVITRSKATHVGTYSFNDARTFVTSDPGIAAVRHIAGNEVLVGMAKARRDISHQQFRALRLVDLDIFN